MTQPKRICIFHLVRFLKITTAKELIRSGWSHKKILKRLIELDYKDIRGLKPQDEGKLNQWANVFRKSPDSYRILIDDSGKIAGYWHFVSLNSKTYDLVKSGRLLDSQINRTNIYPLTKPGTYNMYYIAILLVPELRDTKAILLLNNSFFDAIELFAKKNIYFTEFCANAYTKDGVKFFRRFGMDRIARNISKGSIYWMNFQQLLKRNAKGRKRLIRIYGRHLQHARIGQVLD
jgi:hypothetical protein